MKLIKIEGLFQADPGAPCPLLISDDNNLRLIFYAAENPDLPTEDQIFPNEPIVELIFKRCSYHSFSPPNDGAISGHPYADLGLYSHNFYELTESDLIAKLKTYNRHHTYDNPNVWDKYHHYLLAFKEQLFECIAYDFEVRKSIGNIHHHAQNALNEIYKNSI